MECLQVPSVIYSQNIDDSASFYISHTHRMTACKSCCLTLTTSLWSMVSSMAIETSDVEAGSMTNVVVVDPAAESTRSLSFQVDSIWSCMSMSV